MIIFLYSSHPDPHSSNLHPQPPLTMSHTEFPLEANLGQFCSLIRDFTCAPSLSSSFSDDPFCYHYFQDHLKVPFFCFLKPLLAWRKFFSAQGQNIAPKKWLFTWTEKLEEKSHFLHRISSLTYWCGRRGWSWRVSDTILPRGQRRRAHISQSPQPRWGPCLILVRFPNNPLADGSQAGTLSMH